MKGMAYHYDNSDGTLPSLIMAICSYIALGLIKLVSALSAWNLLLVHIPPIVMESAQLMCYLIGSVSSGILVYKFFKHKKDGKNGE
jgi:uncharacterized protein (DUF983 family)